MNLPAANENIARIFSEIPSLLYNEIGNEIDGVFIYAEFQPGVLSWGFYKDFGDKVVCYDGPDGLSDKLWEAWQAAEPDKRWATLFYTIEGRQFDVQFEYEGSRDEEEYYSDRLDKILNEKYGNKPIEYPKFDRGAGWEL